MAHSEWIYELRDTNGEEDGGEEDCKDGDLGGDGKFEESIDEGVKSSIGEELVEAGGGNDNWDSTCHGDGFG